MAAALAALLTALLAFAHPAAASAPDSRERAVSGHRWLAPLWVSAPATSVLATAGIGALALHLHRRRVRDRRQHRDAQTDADWDRRIAMWERRLGSSDADRSARPPQDQNSDGGGESS
jgi:hypothetical protein